MKIYYDNNKELSEEARKLIDFDADSIRRVIAAERGEEPEVWLAAPDSYQADGHTLRDSESIRLIAYSKKARVVYGTDGCNSCRHILDAPIEENKDEELATLSRRTQLPEALLQRLARVLRGD